MTIRNLSTLIRDFQTSLGTHAGRISLDEILEAFHERGFGVLMTFITLPIALPVPKPPGMSTIFAVPLLLLSVQLALGRHTVWIPAFIRRRTIDRAKLDKTLSSLLPWIAKVEPFIRPRMEWVTQGVFSHLTGIVGAFLTLVIAIPAPGTNTLTGMALALMSAGLVMRDGLAILAGAVSGLIWVVTLASLYIYFGKEGLDALRSFF